MVYAIWYMATVFVLQAFIAIRNPHTDAQTLLIATLFWPVIILLVLGSLALDVIGWNFDTARSPKWFGFRKPTNPRAKGYALTLFTFEFQLYKMVAR